jgi:hypothetical protein
MLCLVIVIEIHCVLGGLEKACPLSWNLVLYFSKCWEKACPLCHYPRSTVHLVPYFGGLAIPRIREDTVCRTRTVCMELSHQAIENASEYEIDTAKSFVFCQLISI